MASWSRQLAARCDGYLAARVAALILPALLLGLASGDERWLKAGMMAVCCLIAAERSLLGWRAAAGQALSAAAGYLLLATLWRWPWAFALACAAMAELGCRLGARQARWRSAANFTFIAALYLGCEAAAAPGMDPLAALPYLALGGAAAVLLRGIGGRPGPLPGSASAPGVSPTLGLAALCVGPLAWLAAHYRLPHSQWLVWSAASVCVGGLAAIRAKCWQRASGAMLGVPCGVLLGALLPASAASLMLLGAGALLSLALFRDYRPAFAARSALAAAQLTLIGGAAALRLLDVGLAGALVCLMLALGQWLAGRT
ncbi:FUSC family protein [Chromobacterium sphagni]|uniref:Integral membrane bound transporter domain-containing protein n=1 Tax=Chromobacterium sphagni TaxID=1903179 RepID=A0A1S1WYP0_9NEIS|nr:FUSC family protein [Chromobacterium sphagni]OHX12427.1 hypothetical protein BI347_02135 [Chromobacterium sphagni]OHX21487.1 hypothetical protein BI344_02870 [Chromobacterium sphagni]